MEKWLMKTIRDIFLPFGTLLDIHVPVHYGTNKPRGFCYVEFCNKKSAIRAKKAVDGLKINGKRLKIVFSKSTRKTSSHYSKDGNFERIVAAIEDFSSDDSK
ncbi:Serine/arginine-rich splicing factor 12, variant 2 [Bonamia ostreae]|uniref:Serine/arginine-rich splicing factor 12, variant 2 n=1 Tax=Bonamia ostreae TaxID=126728 RepID=A0ABV2AKU1_9EUKA